MRKQDLKNNRGGENLVYRIVAWALRVWRSLIIKINYHYYHLEVDYGRWPVSIRLIHHDNYTYEREAELFELQFKLSPSEFILQALMMARNCNFIIFDCGDDVRFVQFWLGDDKYVASWPICKGNDLRRYTRGMLGILKAMGIKKRYGSNRKQAEREIYQYTLVHEDGYDDIVINFGKDAERAAEYTQRVITLVFRQSLDDLRFKLG